MQQPDVAADHFADAPARDLMPFPRAVPLIGAISLMSWLLAWKLAAWAWGG
jgi:hypothetical protein